MKKLFRILLIVIGIGISSNNARAGDFDSIVGKWVGMASTPWTSSYNVSFEFFKNGTYSSNALGPTCFAAVEIGKNCMLTKMPALYYGSDGYNKKKAYSIVTNGNIEKSPECESSEPGLCVTTQKFEGDIVFYFGNTSGTTVKNKFTDLRLQKNQNETTLNFTIYHFDNKNGPLNYTLQKVTK